MNRSPETPDLDDLTLAIGILREAVRDLDPRYLPTTTAARLVTLFDEVERLATAGKTLAARAVERSGAWREEGHRTAAHWMAAETAVPVGKAVVDLETARRLEALPATSEAFRAGELSEPQVREVAAAAVVCVLLSLGGPVLVVRRWMERFGVWVLGAVATWVTFRVVAAVSPPGGLAW